MKTTSNLSLEIEMELVLKYLTSSSCHHYLMEKEKL